MTRQQVSRAGLTVLGMVLLGLVVGSPVAAVAPLRTFGEPQLKCVRVIKAHKKGMRTLQFSPDGKLLASTGDAKLVLWDVATGRRLRERAWEEGTSLEAIFVRGGREIAVAHGQSLWLVSPETLARTASLEPPDDYGFRMLSPSPEGRYVASASIQLLVMSDVETRKELFRVPYTGEYSTVNSLQFAPDGKSVAVTTWDIPSGDLLRILDARSGKELMELNFPRTRERRSAYSLAFHPQGKLLSAACRYNNNIVTWDVTTGKQVGDLKWKSLVSSFFLKYESPTSSPWQGAGCISYSPDGHTLFAHSRDAFLRFFDVATGEIRLEMELGFGSLILSPDGRFLVSGDSESGEIRMWDWRVLDQNRFPLKTAAEQEVAWQALDDKNARIAYQAICSLIAKPEVAVPLLSKRVRRIEPVPAERLTNLIRELDDDSFEVREKASANLAALGRIAEKSLRKAAVSPPTLEMRLRLSKLIDKLKDTRAESRRLIRTMEVLEAIGNAEAKLLLEHLADGAPDLMETNTAQQALRRLVARRNTK